MCIVIIRGIGASDSVAFYTTVGIIERSGRLRSKSLVADNLFRGFGRGFAMPSPTAIVLNRYAIL